jgi:site-specific recombinase XerD
MEMESLPDQTAVTSVPLAEAVTEFLQWLELDRRTSLTTVAAYTEELSRFQAFCARCDRGCLEVTSPAAAA